MPAFTSRLSLYKPGGGSTGTILPDEVADIDQINANFDKIDAVVGARNYTSTTRPATPFSGQIIYETDTQFLKQWSGSAWLTIGGKGPYDDLVTVKSSLYDGVSLGTSDLDTILNAGVYVQNLAADATLARNYPVASMGGTLLVYRFGTAVTQVLFSRAAANFDRVYKRSKFAAGSFTAWQLMSPSGAKLMMPSSVGGATIDPSMTGVVTFNSATSIDLNDVFTGEFRVYKIFVEATTSAASGVSLRLRKAGATDSALNYDNTRLSWVGSTVASVQTLDVAEFQVSPIQPGAARHVGEILLSGFDTSASRITGKAEFSVYNTAPGASHGGSSVALNHSVSDVWDGFRLFPASGTISGRVSVMGVA